MSTDQFLEHCRTAAVNLAEAKRINAEGELLEPMAAYRCLIAAREEVEKAMRIFLAADLGTPKSERAPLPWAAEAE